VATDSLPSTPLLDFDFTTPSQTLGTGPLFPSPQYFPPQSPDSLPSKPQFACTTPSQKLLGTGPLIPQYFTPQSQITPSQLGTGPVLPSAESLTPQSLFQSAEVDSREHRHLSSDTAKQLATQLVAKAQSDVAFGKKILLQLATNGGLEIKKEGCLVLKVLSLFVLHFILEFVDIKLGARAPDGGRDCILSVKTIPSTTMPHRLLLSEGIMPGGVAVTSRGQRMSTEAFGFAVIGLINNSLQRQAEDISLSNPMAKPIF
jgi:hypothetical protein